MKPTTIGVLAGMGPRSTAPFIDILMTECQKQYGARDIQDFPHVLIYSLPAPFFVDRPIDHEHAQEVLTQGLRRLETAGANFIAMPCNTAHVYYDQLAKATGVPLLNMVTEAVADTGAFQRIALCATLITAASQIYQQAIAAAGKQCVHSNGLQRLVTEVIVGVLSGEDRTRPRARWNDALKCAADHGADAVLVACTEINALGDLQDGHIPLADATVALARATIRKYLAIRN